MKLPSFSVGKKQKELYLSLLLYPDAVDAAAWEFSGNAEAFIAGAVTQELTKDSWDERNDAADKCVSTLEAITKTQNIRKVILGLPAEYVTDEGDVKKEIKQHIKKLTHLLELTPIGFVSIYQAIIHQFKQKEGVPPSLILLSMTSEQYTVSLYKIGNFLGHRIIPKEGSLIGHLEDALSSFSDIEILPSRIIIYGTARSAMEDAKRQILEHHWQQKTNFLHFPKAEVLPGDAAAVAVSLAGAAEIGQTIVEEEDVQQEQEEAAALAETEIIEESEEYESPIDNKQIHEQVDQETEEDETIEERPVKEDTQLESEEYQNVSEVSEGDFGFTEVEEDELDDETEENQPVKTVRKNPISSVLTSVTTLFSSFANRRKRTSTERKTRFSNAQSRMPFVIIGIVMVLLFGGIGFVLFTRILPKASVSITVVPKTVEASEKLTIEKDAETAGTTVGGKSVEKSVEGDKTIQVSGKKTIGDPAKGTVTIFNKSLLPRTFKKGTILSTSSLDFTLDDDVSVASASETFSGSTFGKTNAAVTAKEIGSKSNVAAGKEFSISGVSSSIAVARNESAFTGGTSKEMTVVSRTDQDNLIKQLTNDLIAQAKNGFAAGEGEKLIAETIKTQVQERTFSHEVGQETKELKGSATVLISGTAYSEADIKQIMSSLLTQKAEANYKIVQDSISIETAVPTVSKSGVITTTATASARFIPSFDISSLLSQIAGLSVADAEKKLKEVAGVGNATITVSRSLFRQKLPSSQSNITISVETASEQ